MTRKDFELIAGILAEARAEDSETREDRALLDSVGFRFADALVETNPRFDYSRFLKAAGVQA